MTPMISPCPMWSVGTINKIERQSINLCSAPYTNHYRKKQMETSDKVQVIDKTYGVWDAAIIKHVEKKYTCKWTQYYNL